MVRIIHLSESWWFCQKTNLRVAIACEVAFCSRDYCDDWWWWWLGFDAQLEWSLIAVSVDDKGCWTAVGGVVEFASLGCFYGNFGCRNWGMMQGFGAQLMVAVASSANGFYFIVVKAVAAIAVAVARVVQSWGFDTFSFLFFLK